MKERLRHLDYLKGFFILLMVIFHLHPVGESYPTLVDAVYTFHMSAFLIISGYLTNVEKDFKEFKKVLLRLIIPYIIFETIYLFAIIFLGKMVGASNTIENCDLSYFLFKLFECPIGTYWYLHTLIICSSVYYLIYRLLRLKEVIGFLLTAIILYGLTFVIVSLNWENVIYFLVGMYILRSGRNFCDVIKPSFFAVLPLIILFSSSDNFVRGSMAGIAITLLTISFMLYAYKYCPDRINGTLCYLGENSLSIVVFSPIFTVTTKLFVPYFMFDPTRIAFVLFALLFIVSSSLLCARICDYLNISKYIFYKERIYVCSCAVASR